MALSTLGFNPFYYSSVHHLFLLYLCYYTWFCDSISTYLASIGFDLQMGSSISHHFLNNVFLENISQTSSSPDVYYYSLNSND